MFTGWKPPNADLAQAVRDRVVADFQGADSDDAKFNEGLPPAHRRAEEPPTLRSLPRRRSSRNICVKTRASGKQQPLLPATKVALAADSTHRGQFLQLTGEATGDLLRRLAQIRIRRVLKRIECLR